MTDPQTDQISEATNQADDHTDDTEELVENALVEEVSIDGMCGVY